MRRVMMEIVKNYRQVYGSVSSTREVHEALEKVVYHLDLGTPGFHAAWANGPRITSARHYDDKIIWC